MILELIQNVALMVALAVAYRLLATRYEQVLPRPRSLSFKVLTGAIFGFAAIVGMMTPLHFSPGIIFDGRSIVLAVAGVVGGPIPAVVAAIPCIVYRLGLGGAGSTVGVSVIVASAFLGSLLHMLRQRYPWRLGAIHY